MRLIRVSKMCAQPILERDPDLRRLGAALDQASAGRGHIVLVSGEAGIGKTTFVEHFLASIGKAACVLMGHCDPLSTPTPLGPLYDIARQTDGRLQALLDSEAPRAALFSALLAQLADGEKPTLVVVEDIHWADEATLDLVKYLGRRLASTRILIVLTYRDDEVSGQPSLRRLLGDLAVARSTVRIELPRLSMDAVRTMIAERPVDALELHRQTSGNPFYVTEVLSSGASMGSVPSTVRDAVLARAARLDPAGRAVLDAASVIGARIDPAMLECLLGGAVEGLAECMQVGVLEADGEGIAFRHELAREVVLADVDPARRRDLNRRALEKLKGAGRRSDLALLVQYAAGAGDTAAVVEYGVAAARAAASVGAHRQAAAHYARVMEHAGDRPLPERAGYCEAYAEECVIVDELAEAERGRRLAIALWREAGDRLKEGENLAELAWPLVRSGRNAAAEDTSRAAIAVLEPLAPSRQLANAYRIQAHLTMLDRDVPVAVRLGNQAIALAERFDDKLTVAAAENVIGSALLVSGHDIGLAHLERSIALGRELGLDTVVANGHMNTGSSYGEQYRLAEAERHLAEGIAYSAERDLDYANHYMHAWLAFIRLQQGRWSEAAEVAAGVIARPNTSAISRIVALVALGRVKARRGEEAADVLDEALELATQTGTLQRLAPVRAARAEAAWLAGDGPRAAAEAGAAYELATRHCHRWFTGELAMWRRLGGEKIDLPHWASPPFLWQAKGDWRRAAAAWEELGCVYEQARALAGGDTAAQIAALEIFTDLGAGPAAAALRQRLRGAGMRKIPRGPRASTRQNPFGLTTRELQILDCLSSGLTNNRIGARLHVSPKTVDHHVSSVLSKLGAASRGEAAQIARAEQLVAK